MDHAAFNPTTAVSLYYCKERHLAVPAARVLYPPRDSPPCAQHPLHHPPFRHAARESSHQSCRRVQYVHWWRGPPRGSPVGEHIYGPNGSPYAPAVRPATRTCEQALRSASCGATACGAGRSTAVTPAVRYVIWHDKVRYIPVKSVVDASDSWVDCLDGSHRSTECEAWLKNET
jgi:hypothetical protein